MTTLIATIVLLGVLIFIHELGHYLAARSIGVRVERFSIGIHHASWLSLQSKMVGNFSFFSIEKISFLEILIYMAINLTFQEF